MINEYTTLKNPAFFSRGMFLFFAGLILSLIVVFFFELENLFWATPSSLFAMFLGGYFSYYLEVNNEKLRVKNVIFFWVNSQYEKHQIIDIFLNINYGTSESGNDVITKSIVIKTKNKSKKYLLDYNYKFYINLFYTLKKFGYKNNIFTNSPLYKKINRPTKDVHITFKQLGKKYLVTDNNKLIQIVTNYLSEAKWSIGFSSFLFIFCYLLFISQRDDVWGFFEVFGYLNIIFIVPFFNGLYCLLVYLIWGEKTIIYNRNKNTVTYRLSAHSKETKTILFHKFKFHKMIEGGAMHNTIYSLITKDCSNETLNGIFCLYKGSYPNDFYSYLVWYMDNRRPLPPSEVFDNYREIDFENRKKRKFLKPLYSKDFKTPEKTRKQNKERKEINNW